MDDLGKRDSETSVSKNVKYPCKDGTILYTTEGNRAKGDKKIWIKPPQIPWMPSLECLFAWIRMKAWLVEENNYSGGWGMEYLRQAIDQVFFNKDLKVRDICKKFKIPGF